MPQGAGVLGTMPTLDIQLDGELLSINNMINAGIIPSNERIKEYLMRCCDSQSFKQEISKVLSCVAVYCALRKNAVLQAAKAPRNCWYYWNPEIRRGISSALAAIKVTAKEPRSFCIKVFNNITI